MKTRILLTLFLLAMLLSVGASSALAAPQAVCVSLIAVPLWSTPAHWSCNAVPGANDIVIINDGHNAIIDVDGASASQLIVGGGGVASSSLSGDIDPRTLTVGVGGVSISSNGTLNASNGTLQVNGSLTNNGTFNGSNVQIIVGGDVNNQTGATFTSTSGTLTIYGHLTNNGTFNHNNGTVEMTGSSPKTISGVSDLYDLRINNSAGVDLNANTTIHNSLDLNYDLRVGSGYTLTMASGSTTLGNADVVGKTKRTTIVANTNYSFGSPYTAIRFASGGTLPSEIVVELFKTAPGGLANAVQRYYSITPTGGSGYTFDLRLHYLDSELSGINESNLQMWRQDSGRWTLQARTDNNTTDNWVEKTGLGVFSLWALSDSGAPTAVNLSTFDARADAPNALLFVGVGALALIALGAWKTKDERRRTRDEK